MSTSTTVTVIPAGDAPAPDMEMRGRGRAIPVVLFADPWPGTDVQIHLGNHDNPAAYLRAFAGNLLALAYRVDEQRATEARRPNREYRVTFGFRYATDEHPTFVAAHPDGWLTILAPDYDTARAKAVEMLGSAWSNLYEPEDWVPEFFPRGELERVTA